MRNSGKSRLGDDLASARENGADENTGLSREPSRRRWPRMLSERLETMNVRNPAAAITSRLGPSARNARSAISSLPASIPSPFSPSSLPSVPNIPASMIPSMMASRYDETKKMNLQDLMRIHGRVKRDAATRLRAHTFQMVNTKSSERKLLRKQLMAWVDGVGEVEPLNERAKAARGDVASLLSKYCRYIIRVRGEESQGLVMVIVEPLVSFEKIGEHLDSLPPNVEFEGNLRVAPAALRTLPDDFRVHGTLNVANCGKLSSLGNSLVVGGDLDLSNCTLLKELSDKLEVGGNLLLVNCSALTVFPRNLSCGGDANLDGCVGVAMIPSGWRVGGSLLTRRCTALFSIGQWEHLGHGLNCYGCTALTELPAEIRLKGNLELKSCTSLTTLPKVLTVGTYLNLTDCISLSSLPDGPEFSVGGDVYLEGCSSLHSLGVSMLEWPERTAGGAHNIYLGGTSIPETELDWLRDEEPPNLRFHTSRTAHESMSRAHASDIKFGSLNEAAAFWIDRAGLESSQTRAMDLEAVVDKGSERGVLLFFTKLLMAKDFQQPETQQDLARRVVEVLDTLCANDFARSELIARIVDSVDACSDKPIWAINQMNVIVLAAQARGDREKLRKLGLGVMRLDVVHRHVEKKIKSLKFVDDVCVYLRFEIALRDALDLPCSALDMNFPKYISVSSKEISKAKKEALAITDEAFESWLATWPEWQRQLRFEFAQQQLLNWEALSVSSKRASKSLTDMIGNPMEDPVLLGRSVWSLHDLRRHWVETGLDLNGTFVEIQTMQTLQRCQT